MPRVRSFGSSGSSGASRASLYKAEYSEQARKLCALGATDADLAEFFGVSDATVSAWKSRHPAFRDALAAGKSDADDRVEKSLYQCAVGYSHPDVHISHYQGQVTVTPITKHYPPNTTAAIFWLKNRRRAAWKEKVDHEHTGDDGGPVTVARIERIIVDPARSDA